MNKIREAIIMHRLDELNRIIKEAEDEYKKLSNELMGMKAEKEVKADE